MREPPSGLLQHSCRGSRRRPRNPGRSDAETPTESAREAGPVGDDQYDFAVVVFDYFSVRDAVRECRERDGLFFLRWC